VTIKNLGQTPAYETSAWATVRVLDAEALDFSTKKSDKPAVGAIMGPGAETVVSRLVAISPDDFPAIQAGTKRIFVWGRAEYVDAFGKQRWFVFHQGSTRAQEAPGRWGIEPYGPGEQGN